jgi:SAM-dependent methyltransferase
MLLHMDNKVVTANKIHTPIGQYWSTAKQQSAKDAIFAALQRAGRNPYSLSLNDINLLNDLDEFHCFGSKGTEYMAKLAKIKAADRILDIGCGVGGPARHLAIQHGCNVYGLDITPEYIEAAASLNRSLGIFHYPIHFVVGDATSLPLRDLLFDVVWIQVATANIYKKHNLYSEVYRILKPGGRLVMLDIQSGPISELHYPVAWATDDSTNGICSTKETHAAMVTAGLKLQYEHDVSENAVIWCEDQAMLGITKPLPALSFHTLLSDWNKMAATQARNLREKRMKFVYILAIRPC